ncbi:MAG: hypothetical protein PHZ19_00535 [Candidatus Thermoplasmatota archaeon]|nr:hypothetical protein [Candidatus Thermoplasmatota archaeon]
MHRYDAGLEPMVQKNHFIWYWEKHLEGEKKHGHPQDVELVKKLMEEEKGS